MKKLLFVLLVITLAVSLLIGCIPVIADEGEGEGDGKIAFASGRVGDDEIYVMNADGSNQTNLTNNPAEDYMPCFSPDGTMIAFTSYRDGNLEIYVMNADGSNQTRLTNNSAWDGSPSWGP
jgi:TolB protein